MADEGGGEPVELEEIVIDRNKPVNNDVQMATDQGNSDENIYSGNKDDKGLEPETHKDDEGPDPSAGDPAPPIGLRASHKGRVNSIHPDWKYVGARGQNPTPFPTYADTADKPEHYSPNVRYEGDNAMRFNSDVSTTYGGQPGTGRGVKSNTYMDKVFPKTHSNVMRINGSWAMRKDDIFYHNADKLENWNTLGKATHPGPSDPKPAPEKTSWWGRQFNRGMGVVGLIGSAAEGVAGGALFAAGTGADATGVGAIVGVPAQIAGGLTVLNAADQGWASVKQIWTGETQDTFLQKGANAATTALGGSQETADKVGAVTGIGQSLVNPAAGVGRVGKVAEDARTLGGLGKDAKAGQGVDAAGSAAREESAATKDASKSGKDGDQPSKETDGSGGTRVAKPKSKRLQYLGKTPSKYSKTGKEVRDRMRDEGNLRTNPKTGADEFKDAQGNWHPVDSPDTHMGHYPQDAVDYWNETGRQYGAKSPEVREWMLNSNNYRFEYGPENSLRGAQTTSRYLPPLK